jgi:hypothetical protein
MLYSPGFIDYLFVDGDCEVSCLLVLTICHVFRKQIRVRTEDDEVDMESDVEFVRTIVYRYLMYHHALLPRLLASLDSRMESPLLVNSLMNGAGWGELILACELVSRTLLTLGDFEFNATTSPTSKSTSTQILPIDTMVPMGRLVRDLVFEFIWSDEANKLVGVFDPFGSLEWIKTRLCNLLNQLYTREYGDLILLLVVERVSVLQTTG